MQLDFTKIHGAGNDFIVIDDLSEGIELTPQQVRRLCDRHVGVGADGVILVRPSLHADCTAYMHYINSDGSLAQMCGNGVRCFAKYLVDLGFVQVKEGAETGSFVADTLAGKRPIHITVDAAGKLTTSTVNMGEPRFAPEQIPTTLSATETISLAMPLGTISEEMVVRLDQKAIAAIFPSLFKGGKLPQGARMTCVNMGNPHLVVFFDSMVDLENLDIAPLGSFLEKNTEYFPEGINVEFAVIESSETLQQSDARTNEPCTHIHMRVWERGCGETLACGTGACAATVAAVLFEGALRTCALHVQGGNLTIQWRADNQLYLTGPAETVFSGTVEI